MRLTAEKDNKAVGTLLTPVQPEVAAIELPFELTDDQFYEFCQINRDLRIERTAEGEILVMAPANSESSATNVRLSTQIAVWAERDGSGVVFGPDGGFKLPNGATRSPDVAWIANDRLNQLTEEQTQQFIPLCPDFVVELRSPSDRPPGVQNKMREYMENGARLGWLIDPKPRRVYVYRPGVDVERLENPDAISGEPVLPGFVLDLGKIWNTRLRSV